VADEHEYNIATHPFGSEPFRPHFDTFPPTTHAMSLLWEPMPALLLSTMQVAEPIYTYEDTIVIRLIGLEGQLPTEIAFGTTFAIGPINIHEYRHIAVRCLEKRGQWSFVELVPYGKDARPKHRFLPTYIIVVPSKLVKMNVDGQRMDWWNESAYSAQTSFLQRLRYVTFSIPKRLAQLKRRASLFRSIDRRPPPSSSSSMPAGLACRIDKMTVVV
jgi:hypothetical protein